MTESGKTRRAPALRLAYQDAKFLESGNARSLRMLAEYLEPQTRLRRAGVQRTVVIFGSARILPRDVAVEKLRALESQARQSGSAVRSADLIAARASVEMSRYYEEARELARLLTRWALAHKNPNQSLMVCSGGGPGIMEAANRGAFEAGGRSIGLNIKLPLEQEANPYVTPELSFLFRYFFLRKMWFSQPAKALIVFPGGYGTMDELWEFLTLLQTHKMGHRAIILLYGSRFWKRAINFGWLLEAGTIDQEDLKLIRFVDNPERAFEILREELGRELGARPAPRHPFM